MIALPSALNQLLSEHQRRVEALGNLESVIEFLGLSPLNGYEFMAMTRSLVKGHDIRSIERTSGLTHWLTVTLTDGSTYQLVSTRHSK